MASSQQHLLEAINALYNHPDEKVKKQADAWLEEWQQSVEAWSIADAVLHEKHGSLEAQYFAAQTLRTKVSYLAIVLIFFPANLQHLLRVLCDR